MFGLKNKYYKCKNIQKKDIEIGVNIDNLVSLYSLATGYKAVYGFQVYAYWTQTPRQI